MRIGIGVGIPWLGGKPPAAAFAPSDLPNLELWLKPSGLPASGSIATWTDESGNGRDATQATGTAQPTVVNDALNGHAAASFDGGDYVSNVAAAAPFSGTDLPLTAFGVVRNTALSATDNWMSLGNSSNNDTIMQMATNGATWEVFRRDDVSFSKNPSGGVPVSGTDYRVILVFNGANVDYYVDGSKVIDNGDLNVGAFTVDRLGVGALVRSTTGNFWVGRIYETGIYSAVLSAVEVASLDSYLVDKYAL